MNYGNIPDNILHYQLQDERPWDDSILTIKEGLDKINEDIIHAVWTFSPRDPDSLMSFNAWTENFVVWLEWGLGEYHICSITRSPPEEEKCQLRSLPNKG